MAKQRKAFHWKFRDRDNPKKINEWMDNQDNIRDALSFILHHWIEVYGYENVNSYQFREKLHQNKSPYDTSINNEKKDKIQGETHTNQKENEEQEVQNGARSNHKESKEASRKDNANTKDGKDSDEIDYNLVNIKEI